MGLSGSQDPGQNPQEPSRVWFRGELLRAQRGWWAFPPEEICPAAGARPVGPSLPGPGCGGLSACSSSAWGEDSRCSPLPGFEFWTLDVGKTLTTLDTVGDSQEGRELRLREDESKTLGGFSQICGVGEGSGQSCHCQGSSLAAHSEGTR